MPYQLNSYLQSITYQKSWLAIILSLAAIIGLGQLTNIDLFIEDYYYDFAQHLFPWDKSWFAHDLMHGYVKNIILMSGYVGYTLLLIDAIKPWKKLSARQRFNWRFVAAASILVPLVVSSIKAISVLHCPSDIIRYGGEAPFLRLFDAVPAGLEAGNCFPAGHATVGLWMAVFCVFWLPHQPKIALRVFFVGLSAGLVFGWVQQMRGEHFLFHTLWSAWIASAIILLMLEIAKYRFNFGISKPLSPL